LLWHPRSPPDSPRIGGSGSPQGCGVSRKRHRRDRGSASRTVGSRAIWGLSIPVRVFRKRRDKVRMDREGKRSISTRSLAQKFPKRCRRVFRSGDGPRRTERMRAGAHPWRMSAFHVISSFRGSGLARFSLANATRRVLFSPGSGQWNHSGSTGRQVWLRRYLHLPRRSSRMQNSHSGSCRLQSGMSAVGSGRVSSAGEYRGAGFVLKA